MSKETIPKKRVGDPFVVKRCHNFQMKLILNFFCWFGLAGGHASCHDGQHDGHNGCAGKKEVGGPPYHGQKAQTSL